MGDPQDLIERLKILYISLPYPMDIDHAYDIYYGDCSLSPRDFKTLIEDCCKKALHLDRLSFEVDEKVILPNGVESMRMEIIQSNKITMNSNPKIEKLMNTIRFDYANLKLKTFFKKGGLQFSLIGCFPMNSLRRKNVHPKDGCTVCEESQCYHTVIKSSVPKVLRWKTLCPLCIENYVERSVLNEISTNLLASIEGTDKLIVEKYDPFQREI